VTGVPGSGKTTLGRALAGVLGATFVSLDTVKEELWSTSTWADGWALRRAAEAEVVARARAADDDVVIDIWVAPGRDDARVTALFVDWPDPVVQVACVVDADLAVGRYVARDRSLGPHGPTDERLLQRIRDAVPNMAPLGPGPYVEVDTSSPVDIAALVATLRAAGSTAVSPASRGNSRGNPHV